MELQRETSSADRKNVDLIEAFALESERNLRRV